MVKEVRVWRVEVTFGIAFFSQIRSKRFRAVLKLMLSVLEGSSRCMIVGK